MKCFVRNNVECASERARLPRFGGIGSFGDMGGVMQFILACKGNRRQCGNGWATELGTGWGLGGGGMKVTWRRFNKTNIP